MRPTTKQPGRDTSSLRTGRVPKGQFPAETRRSSLHWLIGGGWSPDFSRSYWTMILIAVTFVACVAQSIIGWDILKSSLGFVPSAVWMPSTWLSTLPGQALPVAVTWLTYTFPHMGWFHMISNVIGLLMVGTVIEPMIGTARYLALTIAGAILGVFGLAAIYPLGTAPIAGGSLLVCTIWGFWLAAGSESWWREHRGLTRLLELLVLTGLVAWIALHTPTAQASGFMGALWHLPSLLIGWIGFRAVSTLKLHSANPAFLHPGAVD